MINLKKLAGAIVVVLALCLIIAAPTVLFVLCLKYFGAWTFAIVGFLTTVAWIYHSANEGQLEALITRKKKK